MTVLALVLATGCGNTSQGHSHAHGDDHEHNNGTEHDHGDGQDHNSDNEHGHSHERPTLSYTLFADSLELFVEFPAFIVNEESSFAAHLTHLPDYVPLNKGRVAVQLGNDARGSVSRPSSPGIFRPSITPTSEGTYTLVFEVTTSRGTTRFAIEDITVYESEIDAAHDAPESAGENGITFLKEQAWSGDFGVEKAVVAPFRGTIRCTGELLPAVNNEIGIVASAAGIVSLQKMLLPGTKLGAGTVLATISNEMPTSNMQHAYAKAEAELQVAKSDFERATTLAKENIVSQRELESRRALYLQAKADFDNASLHYSKKGRSVLVPSSGVVAKLFVGEGDYVEAGQLIAKLHVEKSFMLRADVPKFYAKEAEYISDANFLPEYTNSMLSVSGMGGRRIPTTTVVEDRSAFIAVYFELPPHEQLLPHSFVEAFLQVPAQENAIAVPNTALMESEGSYWLYVQTSGEGFEKREVALGANNGTHTIIRKGVQEGEYIVVKGAYRVKQASMSNEVPAHVH